MSDELKRLHNGSKIEQPLIMHSGHVHPKAETPADTVFSRFIQKVGQIFNRTQPVNKSQLGGRIKEMQTMADSVLNELLDFKKRIKKSINHNLYSLAAAIIDPIIKEAERVPHGIDSMDNTAHQVKIFSKYVDSIEKAKLWAEIGTVNTDLESLEQALIKQIATEFLMRIDRDIQVIQDYLNLALSAFEMSPSLENEIKEKLMPDLSPKIIALQQLKAIPKQFSIESFLQWRSHSDHEREAIFGTALHIIDEFSDEFLPSPRVEKESDHSDTLLYELYLLETKIKKIDQEIKKGRKLDKNQRKSYISTIERLEFEAHQLNANLHLSHEHSKRLEYYLETLLNLREELS